MVNGSVYNAASDTGRQSGQSGQTSLLSFLKGRKAAGRAGSSSPTKHLYPEAYDYELNEEVGQ
jgi:hypothetical protein